jgi:hypothetical protein
MIKYVREIKPRTAVAKASFNRKKHIFTSKLNLNLKKKLANCYIWSMAFCGAETETLWKANQKFLENF